MKKFQLSATLWLHTIAASLFIIIAVSCNNNKKAGEEKEGEEKAQTATAATAGPACMLLSKNLLNNNWVKRYTDPTNPPANLITVIKFYATYDPKSTNYNMEARGYNGSDAQVGPTIKLATGVACNQSLPPLLTGRSYDVTLADLNILKADGSLVDFFENIILIPQVYSAGGYDLLKFQLDIEIGSSRSTYRNPVLPCPPCINCKPQCIEPMDTLQSKMSKDTLPK